MNIVLLTAEDFFAPGKVQLRDRRFQHIRTVLAAQPGQQLKVGLLNGNLGKGIVTRLNTQDVELDVALETTPPPPTPISLLLALPRPKALRRILQSTTALGIKQIILINSYRVEKSYWQSPFLQAKALEEQLCLGLEQAADTLLPEVLLRPRFKPFVEDELPALTNQTHCLLADPYTATACPANCTNPTWLAVGPEGGFIPYETECLEHAGFQKVQLGSRILRVETAVSALLGRLLPA